MWHKGSGYQEQQQTRLKFLIKRLRCLLDSQALQRCFFQITFTQRPVLSSAAADMVTATWLGLCCTFHLCKRFPFFTFSHSEMSLSHCNVTLAQRQNGSVPLDWVFVISIPERRSSSSAWDVTLIYTFTFTDVTLVWHKGSGYQQTRSVPLDWVFVVLFICVRGSPKSEILLSHCNITLVWHKGRLGQSHLIGSLLYPPALLSQWELWKWRTINNTRGRDYAIQRYSRS